MTDTANPAPTSDAQPSTPATDPGSADTPAAPSPAAPTPSAEPSPSPPSPSSDPIVATGTETSSSGIDDKNSAAWRTSIPDELRPTVDRFNSPADLAQSYANLRKRLDTPFQSPGENASADDISLYRKRLGVPDSPDGYQINTPEALTTLAGDAGADGLAEQMKQFAAKAHELNAPPAVAQGLMDFYAEIRQGEMQQAQETMAQSRARAEAALKKEWGEDYQENITIANRAIKTFGGDYEALLEKTVNGVPLGDDPDFIKFAASFGRNIGESVPEMVMDRTEITNLEERFNELNSKYVDAADPIDKQKIKAELDAVSQRLYPG